MKVEVLLFAAAKQTAGCEMMVVEMPDGSNVGQLREALLATCPALSGLLPSALFAIDLDYVRNDAVVRPNSEIALIPPVGGG